MKNKALKEILLPITIIKYHQVLASTFQMFIAENLQGQSPKKKKSSIFYFYKKKNLLEAYRK